jgi:tRNA 2-thiouridine synthesizing protein E
MHMTKTDNDLSVMPEVDEDGFLVDAQPWTKEVAEILAQPEVPQGLTEEHWKLIDYMRQYYLRTGSVPPVRKLARDTGMTLRRIKALFPQGLTKGPCRLAGIPRIAIRPSFLYP